MKRSASNNKSPRQKRTKSYHCGKERVGSKSDFNIQAGMRGVLVMATRGREARALREAIDLFIHYADQLYPHIKPQQAEPADEKDEKDDDDLEASIAKELAEIKETKHEDKRFVNISTGTDCLLFIKTHPDIVPTDFVHAILSDIEKTKVQRTRYISRIVPVERTCAVHIDEIINVAKQILKPHFHEENVDPKTFCVVYKSRNCDKADRHAITEQLAAAVGRPHIVELKKPEFVIVIEILQSICMMSVVKDFYALRKYNVESILGLNEADKNKAAAKAAPPPTDKQDQNGDDANK
ncbi:hypothetical protein BC940DRAFT_308334 [Gongronella butleri]|nr:hypothetical protein BC940DRAFT_308334 [Gongronella butleri]